MDLGNRMVEGNLCHSLISLKGFKSFKSFKGVSCLSYSESC